MMITIVHGGQTGVDRGAHEAALDNGWHVAGYMPRDGRDELGKIPEAVSRFLVPHDKSGLAARTEANVRAAAAALIIARDADDPRTTPGTAKTIDLAATRRLPRLIVDPTTDAMQIARWIRGSLLKPIAQQLLITALLPRHGHLSLAHNARPQPQDGALHTLPLPPAASPSDPLESAAPRLLVAGPRESKWQGARVETAALLRRVAHALTEISQKSKPCRIL